MSYTPDTSVMIDITDDGLFMAYLSTRHTCYAFGETEDEARENLLERFDFRADQFADFDEYAYLAGAFA